MSKPEIFVLDASVAAKWFFKEEMSEKSLVFLERLRRREIRVVVPEFFYSELGSVCSKRVRRDKIPVKQAITYSDSLSELPLQPYSDRELADVALENAFLFNISVYDALYVSLAEIYCAPFVTADKALFEKCRKRFDFIEYLGDIK